MQVQTMIHFQYNILLSQEMIILKLRIIIIRIKIKFIKENIWN